MPGRASLEASHALYDLARREHPSLALSEEAFASHLARHIEEPHDLASVATLRVADLFLACACASGDPAAITLFRARYGEDIRRVLRRVRVGGMETDDLAQELERRMYVPPAPKIADFSGRGDLRAWVRVVATRFALDLARLKRHDAERPTDEPHFAALPAASDSPDLAFFRRHYRDDVKRAIEEAARALPVEERNSLREHYVRGLTVDQIAAVHGIHRATAARRVQHAREVLVDTVRRVLAERHGLTGDALASMMGLVRSQLVITMDRVLA